MDTRDDRDLLASLLEAHAAARRAQARLVDLRRALGHAPALGRAIEVQLARRRDLIEALAADIRRLGGVVPTAPDTAAQRQGLAVDGLRRALRTGRGVADTDAAAYCALIIDAEAAGEQAIAATCQCLLHGELAMADWLRSQRLALVRARAHAGSADVTA